MEGKVRKMVIVYKLMQMLCLSSLLILPSDLVHAHEVQPAIADLSSTADTITLEITLNAEAFLAGIDLDGLQDTGNSDNAPDYDALRSLPTEQLSERLQRYWPTLSQKIQLLGNSAPIPMTLEAIEVMDPGNIELPRDTRITLSAARYRTVQAVTLTWARGNGALVLRQVGVDDPFTGYLSGGDTSPDIRLSGQTAPETALSTFGQYVPVGFAHILPLGLDHILFVLGLFFLSPRLRPLLWQVSAFTLAHTVTLAMGALGWVTVPASVVEPLIAASIVFVAVENVLSRGVSPWRPVIVFGFGLLHGLGFASVLGQFGLPEDQFIPALLGFNVGVELGQLVVIACTFALVFAALRVDRGKMRVAPAQIIYGLLAIAFIGMRLWSNALELIDMSEVAPRMFLYPALALTILCLISVTKADSLASYRRFVAVPASLCIALVGAYWFVERSFF